MSINYKSLFQKFPVIEDQFDLIAIDCIKMGQSENYFYVPIIRYMMRNHKAKKVEAGLTLLTRATCVELADVAEFIATISSIGMFPTQVSAYGTIYTEDMQEITDVNWNEIAKERYEIEDGPSSPEPTIKQYLH